MLAQGTIDGPHRAESPNENAVLTKATIRAADLLGLKAAELAVVLGVSAPTVSRMKRGAYQVERGTKAFELAVLFVRMFRGLGALTAGDDHVAKAWLRSHNLALGATPLARIQTVAGLTEVVMYVDSRRAQL